jgi:uncharacterized protein YggE
MMRPIRLAAAAALVAVPALVVAATRPEGASGVAEQLRTEGITVSGTSVARSTPDQADMSFGVMTQGGTAGQALAANSTAMERVLVALRRAGIAAADLRTEHVSIQPRFSESGEEIVGYTAQNSVAVRVRDLAAVGTVIDAAVAAGANTVSGPALSRGDQSQLYRDALRAGVADARAKAEAIAAAAGVSLGRVVGVEEANAGETPMPYPAQASDRVPIEPGTQEIRASVVVTFAVV